MIDSVTAECPTVKQPSFRLPLALAVVDAGFKVFAFFAWTVTNGFAGADRWVAFRAYALISIFTLAADLVFLRSLTESVERWWKSGQSSTPGVLWKLGHRVDALPRNAALGNAMLWLVTFTSLAIACHRSPVSGHQLAFLAAAVTAVPFMIYMIARVLARPWHEALARRAQDRGIELPSTASLRNQLVYFCFALCAAPTFAFVSFVLGWQHHPLAGVAMSHTLVWFVLPIPAFWIVSALLMTQSITQPVARLAEAISTIARTGDAYDVVYIPVVQQDEIGRLTTVANEMIARLSQSETERSHAMRELAQLNHTLEARVEQETEARGKAELKLRQAQKLESVGRLAAGIAHEINTPVQFVSDSFTFIDEATRDVLRLVSQSSAVMKLDVRDPRRARALAMVSELEEEVDVPYLVDELPKSITRALAGLKRVAEIVKAMKEFAHPGQIEMSWSDLNRAIESTLVVSKNEYKYVADVVCDLQPLPPVNCHLGELNQVVLNLIVNASHAIEERVKGSKNRGTITIRTRVTGEHVVISIGDTGGGIPDAIRDSIFDPFFTTKGVGKGTGQGLAIARSVIVEKHRGHIHFDSELGVGTTFHVQLPIAGPNALAIAA